MTGTTITSSTTAGYRLDGTVANPVTVALGVSITNVDSAALGSALSTYWTIVNDGTLRATGKSGQSDGVLLAGGGGSVTNMVGGTVAGYYAGVSIAGSGSVVNSGSIATENISGAGFSYNSGVFTATTAGIMLDGGGVSNTGSGVISSYLEGVVVGGGGSVVNAGSILASSPVDGIGVVLLAGGSVDNRQGGTLRAGLDGVLTFGPAATVSNQGVVYALGGVGIGLIGGGSFSNASTGYVRGYSEGILTVGSAASSIINDGSLLGAHYAGAWLDSGGGLTNTTSGHISGYHFGVLATGGSASVVNTGTIEQSAVFTRGTTAFLATGVELYAGGSVTNIGSGAISGYYFGVKITNGAGSVFNAGTIVDAAVYEPTSTIAFASAGVQVADGGVVTNASGGYIKSKWIGVQIGDASSQVGGTLVNYGTIIAVDAAGDGAGVWIHGPGAITNQAGGIISGGGFGIVAYYQTTVVNQGTVFGQDYAFDAVRSGYADRIIDMPGAVFSGIVKGGDTLGAAVYSTLELASGSSAGTIADIGTFVDFGQIALDAGATWSVGGSIVAGETVAFSASDASLILTSPSADAGTISGFSHADTIVLSGITDATGVSFNGGDTLTVSESIGPGVTLAFDDAPALSYAVVDGSTDLFVPCFLPGTHILTDRGEVLVEKLQVGDVIVTLSGRTRRLCWIGQGRTLATRGRRTAATPVIVRKGALSDNVPYLDLHITKGHSLYFDGALIPIEFLVNHRSILWDDRAQEVTVFHLELDAHDVLIANGVAAESYRDDGNRWLFQNANAGWEQPPKPVCAPVLTGGPLVDAVWQRLLERAGPRPGLPLTEDPDLHLVVDGQRVDAFEVQGAVRVFRLNAPPQSVWIGSREAVPAELGLARDARSLGVAMRRIAVRQGSRFVVLKADDARLVDGFHAYEAAGDLRWTDGSAILPVDAFAGFCGAVEVVVHLAATMMYPNGGDRTVERYPNGGAGVAA